MIEPMRDRDLDVQTDPSDEARHKLFPPLRNRVLARAANALAENRPDLAEPLVSGILEKNPAEPDALNLMADIARRAGQFEEAERHLSRCIAASPASLGFRFNHAIILRRLSRFDEAVAQLDTLLEAEPRNSLFREQKAHVLRLAGRHAEALVYRRELTEENPRSADAWLEYAHALRSAGLGDECVAAYRKTLEFTSTSIPAYSHLAGLKTYRFSAAEIAQMESLITVPGLSATDRADLHFALGKALADKGAHAKAFDHYAKGNALRRIGVEFDPDPLTAHRRNCEFLFTKTFFRERSDWGCSSRAPIFIVGMPRSGSTLIEQILSSHSTIEGLGELADLDTVIGRQLSTLNDARPVHEFWIDGRFEFRRGLIEALPRAVKELDKGHFHSLGEEYLEFTSRHRATTRAHFTDKGLRNFGHVGLIPLMLPNAKIIDARRHPLDCGWSCFRSDFPSGQPFAHRLADIGRIYADYVTLMEHFDRVLPGRVHRVLYEDLIADPESEIRRLLEYLGLGFEAQCLRPHENRRTAGTISSEQVRAPLYGSGIGQWRPYEQWLGPLKSALGAALDRYPGGART